MLTFDLPNKAVSLLRHCIVTLLSLIVPAIPAFAQAPVSAPPPQTTQSDAARSPVSAEPAVNTYQTLAAKLGRKIDETDWNGGKVSIIVRDAQLPITVFEHDANRFVPAGSLTQIITAGAALNVLGPAYRFTTELFVVGADPKTKSATALVVRGSGDPSLSVRYVKKRDDIWKPFDEWAAALKKLRIKTIDGPVIGDGSAFDDQFLGPGWPMDKLGDPAYPSIGALNFNHNCIEVDWKSKKDVDAAPVFEIFPKLEKYVFISSNVKASSGAALGRKYERVRDGNLINATGTIPPNTRAHDRAAIDNPSHFFAEALRARVMREGIKVMGPALSDREMVKGRVPGEQTSVSVRFSPPLTELLEHMMRYDEALEAEVLFKTLGRRKSQATAPGSFDGGINAIRDYLDGLRLGIPAATISDGSGNSDFNRITARQLIEFISRIRALPEIGVKFDELFPQAGSPGIQESRFQAPGEEKKSPESLPIWAKSASGPGIEAMAGRMNPRVGNPLIFAIIVDGSTLPEPALRQQVDALLLEMMN